MITNEHIDRFFELFDENDRKILNGKYKIWNYFGNIEFNNEIISINKLKTCIEVLLCEDATNHSIRNEIILPNTELYDHIISYFIAEKLKI